MKQTSAELSAAVATLRKCHRCCNAAIALLADIVTTEKLSRTAGSALVVVDHFMWEGLPVTARILGPTRLDGGLLLLTQGPGRGDTKHRVYILEDLYNQLRTNPDRTEFTKQIEVLVEKAIAKRHRVLAETTNYFSGITGKVVKIL